MEGSKRITKVFGQLRLDYRAKHNRVRPTSTEQDLEHFGDEEPSVRYARVKSVTRSKQRGRS
jgi:hypothetical protein